MYMIVKSTFVNYIQHEIHYLHINMMQTTVKPL